MLKEIPLKRIKEQRQGNDGWKRQLNGGLRTEQESDRQRKEGEKWDNVPGRGKSRIESRAHTVTRGPGKLKLAVCMGEGGARQIRR